IGGSLLPVPSSGDGTPSVGRARDPPVRRARRAAQGWAAIAAARESYGSLGRRDRLDELRAKDAVAAVDEGLQDHAGRAGRERQDGLAVLVEKGLWGGQRHPGA